MSPYCKCVLALVFKTVTVKEKKNKTEFKKKELV